MSFYFKKSLAEGYEVPRVRVRWKVLRLFLLELYNAGEEGWVPADWLDRLKALDQVEVL